MRHVRIVHAHELSDEEKENLLEVNEANRRKGVSQADAICRRHRGEGRLFDEIMEGWEQA